MIVQITNVNLRYVEGDLDSVQVHFQGYDEHRTIHVGGYIPMTADEYKGNEALDTLEGIVRQRVSERILEVR